jgi:hypothetical protein
MINDGGFAGFADTDLLLCWRSYFAGADLQSVLHNTKGTDYKSAPAVMTGAIILDL